MAAKSDIRFLPTESKPIVIGPQLRQALRREVRRLLNEWKISISTARRQQIEKQLAAIFDLLEGGDNGTPR